MRIRLDIPLSLVEICREIDTHITDEFTDVFINYIALDSRLVKPNDLFIAINGKNYRGSDFCGEAIKRGAYVISESMGAGIITVSSAESALGKIASLFKSKLTSLKHTVMITGSVGKSTTKEFIKSIAMNYINTHATVGNFNNLIGAPISILHSAKNSELLVLEAGMNAAGEISRISKIAMPDIGIITNIGTAHIGKLGSRENTAKAKIEIQDGMTSDKLLVPADEPLLFLQSALRVAFSDNENADYSIIARNIYTDHIDFTFKKGGLEYISSTLGIGGAHMLKPLAFAIAAADIIGISRDDIKCGIAGIGDEQVRSRYVDFGDFRAFDDSYNASCESVCAALDFIALHRGRPLGALLADMYELGECTEELHRKIGAYAAKCGISRLYLFGEYAEYIAAGAISEGFAEKLIFINTDINAPEKSAEQILKNHLSGELILMKGSHSARLSRVLDYIKIMEG